MNRKRQCGNIAENNFACKKSGKLTIGDISIDCKDAEKLRGFYAELSGWERRTPYDYPANNDKLYLRERAAAIHHS